MSFPILTTSQYDATRYAPVGTVVVNRVESISMLRSAFAGFGAAFGGKNTIIQTAIDNLQAGAYAEFTSKVQNTYPNTAMVVALNTDISEVSRSEGAGTSYMIMTMAGTCLAPLGAPMPMQMGVPTGGARRRTFKLRRH
jgi:uncharacterized protein YbjQ (UPF0145 family)